MTTAALESKHLLWPEWRVSPRVKAFVTTREGGREHRAFYGGAPGADGLNLGLSTGDDPEAVAENHCRVLAITGLPEAAWLSQIHSA